MCGLLKHTQFLLKLSIILWIGYSGSTLRLLLGRWVYACVYVWVSPMRSSNDDCGGLNVTRGRTVTKKKRHLLQQNVTSLLSLPLLCSVSCCVAAWSWRLTVFSQKSWNTVHFHSTTGMTSPLSFFLRLGALIERLLFNGHMLNNGEALCVSKHTHIHLAEVHHTKDPGRHKYIVFKFEHTLKFDMLATLNSATVFCFTFQVKS